MLDWLLTSGTVIDGTGSPGARADVGLAGGRIAAVGSLAGREARRTVDVAGSVVCPGFIDVHSHSEFSLLRGDDVEARLRQGITTDLLSPDGFAYAPASPSRLADLLTYLEVFNGPPDEGWEWSDPEQYLDLFDGRTAINVVPQVGFLAIRAEAVGWDPRPADPSEIGRMQELTRQGMETGASGIQVGLDYFPAGHASTDELVAVGRVVAEYGGVYSSHVRGIRGDPAAGVKEALVVGRKAGVAVHISHLFGSEDLYQLLTDAREGGVDVTFDAYPYMAASSHLAFCLPKWFDDGPPERLISKLGDPAVRAEAAPHIEEFFASYVPDPGDAYFSALPAGPYEHLQGRPLTDAIGQVGRTLAEVVCTLLAECRLRVLMIYRWNDEAKLRRAMTHPLGMVGSDGLFRGTHPHPRGFGAHARVLAHLVRDRGWLELPDAIRRMTSMPADRYGLADRGAIRPGAAADVTVFDPDRIRDRASFDNGRATAEGVSHVFVNGKAAIESGRLAHTSAGRVLRASNR
ncbi:MAG: amidohydrolase family protein [Acidimicrobiia bacterium]|nr:amidohydrolase family protein [Acidimicrobiia bacterium]